MCNQKRIDKVSIIIIPTIIIIMIMPIIMFVSSSKCAACVFAHSPCSDMENTHIQIETDEQMCNVQFATHSAARFLLRTIILLDCGAIVALMVGCQATSSSQDGTHMSAVCTIIIIIIRMCART